MEKKHYYEIDILKGIAIVMVILGHAIIRFPINLHEVVWTNALYDWVETTHMPLFFMVSGFCFSYRGNYSQYINKKFQRILIPFIIFNLVDCVPRQILSTFVNRPRSITESISNICLEGGEYWFLYSLFSVFLIFPLITKVMKNKTGQIFMIVFCVFLKFAPFLPTIFLIKRTSYHLLYFVIGYTLKQYISLDKITNHIKSNKIQSLVVVIGLSVLWVVGIPFYVKEHTQILGIPLAFIGIIWSYYITVLVINGKVRDLFIGFGTYSLQLYLLNGFTLVFSRTLTIKVMGFENPFVIVAVNMMIDLFISYLFIKYIVTKFKITRKIFGIVCLIN